MLLNAAADIEGGAANASPGVSPAQGANRAATDTPPPARSGDGSFVQQPRTTGSGGVKKRKKGKSPLVQMVWKAQGAGLPPEVRKDMRALLKTKQTAAERACKEKEKQAAAAAAAADCTAYGGVRPSR